MYVSLRRLSEMKKAVLILTSVLFLNTSTELHQVFRLPFLLEHYRQHRQQDSCLSFISFLKIHYTNNHPEDNDDNEDNRLPFKDAGNINHTDIPIMGAKSVPAIAFEHKSVKATYRLAYIPDQRADSIFHPPNAS